jgi:glycosyltransferase involved in cell wall biosynthesis
VRVIHVAPTPFGEAGLFGGGERYPLELARALAAHIDCELVTFGRFAHTEHEENGLRRRTLRAVTWLGGHPAHPLAPALVGAVSGADIVHTHHMRSLPSRLAAVSARALGKRTVVTDHGLAGGTWHGLLLRLFDLFLTVSAYSARELCAPSARTRVIYGGADALRFAPDASLSRSGVLFVGRLTPHKGVDRLLQALPAGVPLKVVGSTGHDPNLPERDYPRLLQRLAAGRDVQLLGSLPDDDVALLYRTASVLVLPSVDRTCYGRDVRVSELLGLAVLEAMASGTPVIASRIGGLPEVVEDGVTGFMVTPGSVPELHDRLQQVSSNPSLAARLGRAARERVLARFTWQAVAQRCLEAYSETPRSPSCAVSQSCADHFSTRSRNRACRARR